MKKTKMISICSLMAAMCVAILAIGSLIESLDVTLSIVAGLVVMVIATEYGNRAGFSVFAVAGVLSLLLPLKSPAILFLAFGGWYPIVQKKINMLPPISARVVKFLIFNAVLFLLLVLSAFVAGITEPKWMYFTLALIGNLCFYLYDILLDRVMIWYVLKLRKRLKF
jgi:hypothetical protein